MTAYLSTVSKGPAAVSEAAQWLDEACAGRPVPPLLIVVGLGEGHLLDVLEQRGAATKVLAIEPDPQMAGAFAARRDWSRWRASGRLAHLVHPDYAGADEAWRMFPKDTTACQLMVNPRLDPRHLSTGDAARVAQKILYGVKANAEARRQFAPRYLTNVIRNVPAIARGADVRALTNAFCGVPAVIAAAGPSLDAAIPELARVGARALLIAVDTALRPLLHAGIAPHLVVAIDPSTLNARHFQALPDCPDTWLVAESALDRSATTPFDERTFWLRVSKHQPWPWLNERGVDIGQIDVWGSVLTAAVQVAILAGCDPIVLVGADLAFTGGRPYCRSTTYEFDWAWSLSVGRTLEQAWQHHIDSTKPRASIDLHGKETLSSGSLEAFRDWIVSRAKKSGRRVVNATGEGILFGDGVEQGTLASGLSASIDVPSMSTVAARARRSIDERGLAAQVNSARRLLDSSDMSASPLAQWVDFSGEGFDAASVGAALDEAHTALVSATKATHVVERARPWTRATPGPTRVMTHLPEAMARLRAALAGETLPDVPGSVVLGDADRATLLIETLEIVSHVRDLLAGQKLKLTQHAPLVGRVPASAICEWPEDARWGVECFEALIGKAWLTSTPRRETFINGPVLPRVEGESRTNGPHYVDAAHACVGLGIEWLRCALSFVESKVITPDAARLIALESLASSSAESRSRVESTLTIAAKAGARECALELPIDAPVAALTRVFTGTVQGGEGGTIAASVEHPAIAIQVSLSPVSTNRTGTARTVRRHHLFEYRWLTDSRLQRAAIAYAVDGGVVCSRLHARESVVVRSDGRVDAHHTWPRPITSELPFGEGGAVAWDQGAVTAAGTESSYVMYRRAAKGELTIEPLPVRPSLGAWWNGRLYLSHAGSDAHPGRGIISWVPGEQVRFEISGLAAYDMHPQGEWLAIEPRHVGADGKLERRLVAEGWVWQPGQTLRATPLGPYGASSGRSRSHGWAATAYPESDVVTLMADDGLVIPVTVYYPSRVAWVGRSLLVSSVQSGLLLFENLADELDLMRRAA